MIGLSSQGKANLPSAAKLVEQHLKSSVLLPSAGELKMVLITYAAYDQCWTKHAFAGHKKACLDCENGRNRGSSQQFQMYINCHPKAHPDLLPGCNRPYRWAAIMLGRVAKSSIWHA